MLREGKKEDADQIVKIKIDSWRDTYTGMIKNNVIEDMNYDEECKRFLKNFNKRKIVVYEKNEKILGYAYYGENRDKDSENLKEYTSEIYAIYVRKDYRKTGIGSKIINYILNDLKSSSNKILLWCLKENSNAISFYGKNGFSYIKSERKLCRGTEVEEICLGRSIENKNYRLTRYVSYLEKDGIFAVYANFDLIFLKNNTAKWFKEIITNDDLNDIPKDFLNFLEKKEVIECG